MRHLAFCLAVYALACGPNNGEPISGAVGPGVGGAGPTEPLPDTLFEGKSQHSERAAPIRGGTLLVTRDDATVVAADPDRDRVSFVRLRTLEVQSVDLSPGTMPGRVIELAAGRLAMLLHGTGSVLSLDVGGSEPVFERQVCAQPRGLAYDAAHNVLLVACRSGLLLRLDADSGRELSRASYDDDLLDVVVRGHELILTRARSAEHLILDEAGKVVARGKPSVEAALAFRSLVLPNGELLTAHQHSRPEVGTSYGTFGDGCGSVAMMTALSSMKRASAVDAGPPPSKDPRDALAMPTLSFEQHLLAGFVGPIDMSLSSDGSKLALLAVGNGFGRDFGLGSLMLIPLDPARGSLSQDALDIFDFCRLLRLERPSGEPVAVALNSRGRAFVQSREPAALVLDNGVSVSLGSESRADTGLALFHLNAFNNISCASCHPGGLEDGRNWFAPTATGSALVPRRTQSLAGGLRALAPYHWSGEFVTFPGLVSGVMMGRMMAPIEPTPDQIDSLAAWLEGIPAPSSTDGLDAAAVERGQVLFASARTGCHTCHGGVAFTDNAQHDLGTGGRFYTPPLLGVGNRAPYLHDGCALELAGVLGVCGGAKHDVRLPTAEANDLVQFLRSL